VAEETQVEKRVERSIPKFETCEIILYLQFGSLKIELSWLKKSNLYIGEQIDPDTINYRHNIGT
jgi:hypothetical protein